MNQQMIIQVISYIGIFIFIWFNTTNKTDTLMIHTVKTTTTEQEIHKIEHQFIHFNDKS